MNGTIKKFLDDDKITQEEYNILFKSKSEWYKDSEYSHKELRKSKQEAYDFFTYSLEKIITLQSLQNFFDLSFIDFPNFNISNFSNLDTSKRITFQHATFQHVGFHDAKFSNVDFFYSKFTQEAYFWNVSFNSKNSFTMFQGVIFDENVYFNSAIFEENILFFNTRFYKRADFSHTIFKSSVNFSNATFEEIDATNMSFNKLNIQNIKFNQSKFLGLSGYENDQKVTIRKKHFENKESSRLIKAHFEKENNIIEANKYFQIEQELYIEQLKKEEPTDKNKWKNLFVLYLNKYVSNFGTDWIRPLLVMFIFGYLASLCFAFLQHSTEGINFTNSKLLLFGAFLYSLLVYYFYHKKLWVAFTASILVFISLLMGDTHLREISNDISKLINPLNIFKSKDYFEHIAPYGMFVKLIMATLIYQFIIAFRQNTRRK